MKMSLAGGAPAGVGEGDGVWAVVTTNDPSKQRKANMNFEV